MLVEGCNSVLGIRCCLFVAVQGTQRLTGRATWSRDNVVPGLITDKLLTPGFTILTQVGDVIWGVNALAERTTFGL